MAGMMTAVVALAGLKWWQLNLRHITLTPITPTAALRAPRIFHHLPGISQKFRPPFSASKKALQNVQTALQHGWAEGTVKNYGYTLDRFLRFCVEEKIPPKLQLPTDEFVLCAFAASGAGVHAGSTARNNIAALKAWHVAQNQPWKGGSRLHYVLAGVENLAPESSKRPPRPPINAAMLRVLYRGLDFTVPRDVAVFAAACVAFWGQCRLGEILPISGSDTALAHKPTRAHVSRSHRDKRATKLRLPRTKTKKSGDDVVLVAQDKPIDPEIALRMHLQVNCLPSSAPLFADRTRAGFQTLTRPKFLQRCNEIWAAAGYPHTTGHSFRIGGTTELLLAEVAPDVVRAMGRWSSDAFHRYWRSLEDLAPIHATHIGSARHSG
ncbi:DNA breaking-rejoining enzyme [Mycena metata]|uniref:DNA breaking-rejoining enzyme n=1 Tax=Mycena metata TaxID=1033252 RepID=A0AAD7I5E6_9AGAR|nr:DNA breaking-rejoining enzyme [Mycena metata]